MTPRIDCSTFNRITVLPATLRKKILNGTQRLYGASVTDGGCVPSDPVKAAKLFASFGFNHLRFHHSEFQDVAKMLRFADELYKVGVRFSIGLCDKLHEVARKDMDTFKRSLVDENAEAEAIYAKNLERLRSLIEHPGCVMVTLDNEFAHLTTPDKAKRFYGKWAERVRAINPIPLLTGFADGWTSFEGYGDVAKGFDVAVAHIYGDDEQASGRSSWISEGWNHRVVLNAYHGRVGKTKPMIINEFGSYRQNPHQASNLAFMLVECMRRGLSCTWFAFATNEDGWNGKGADKFTMTTDPMFADLAVLGAHLYKYGKPDGTAVWGGDKPSPSWEMKYSYIGSSITADEKHVEIQVSKTKRLFWNLDKGRPWSWLAQMV